VSEGEYHVFNPSLQPKRKGGPKPASSSPISESVFPNYQGIIFFKPFFFLLLDFFLESLLSSVLAVPSVLLALASGASLVDESAFAGC